jgi:hypothetical protein
MRPALDPSTQKPCPPAVRPVPQTALEPSPALLPALMRCQPELLPRLVTYYRQLQRLPRRMRRALQRQWRLSLGAVALMLALGQSPLEAATIQVQGSCSLVVAIRAANTDRARGGCPAGRGADTIVLPPGSTQTLTSVQNTDYGPTRLPVIRSEITLSGRGSTIVRDSEAPEFRILTVSSTGKLTLTKTTVSGGSLLGADGDLRGGGGLNAGGTLILLNSTISGNEAYGGGGGVSNSGGTITITNSTISGNEAYGGGGGVSNLVGTMTITNSTISGNEAYSGGGGVSNVSRDNTMTITNSTISGNEAYFIGGVSNGGTMTITNSTISGNRANYDGDTVESVGGVSNNGTLTLIRTLVTGNTAPTGSEINNRNTVLADNHNLFGVDGSAGVDGFSPGTTDVVPDAGVLLSDILDPFLDDHGGSTLTHALVPGSPAINAGPSTCPVPGGGVLLQDQRGVQRPQEGACDIGAYEFLPVAECRGHVATLVGSSQADVLVGTSGHDVIRAWEGDDVVDGKGGNDIICSGLGNDRMLGGTGQDQLFGGQGNDTLEGGSGKDLCDGDEGKDTHAGGCEKLRDIP